MFLRSIFSFFSASRDEKHPALTFAEFAFFVSFFLTLGMSDHRLCLCIFIYVYVCVCMSMSMYILVCIYLSVTLLHVFWFCYYSR